MKTTFTFRAIVGSVASFAIGSLFFLLKAPNLEWSLTYALWVLPAVAGAIYLFFRGETRLFWVSIVALAALATSLVLRFQDWTRNCTDCSPIGVGSFLSWDLGTQVRALLEIFAFVSYLIALAWLLGKLMQKSLNKSRLLIVGNVILLLEAFFLFSDLIASSYWQTPEVFSDITKAYFLANFKIIYSLTHGVAFIAVFAFICWPKLWETNSEKASK